MQFKLFAKKIMYFWYWFLCWFWNWFCHIDFYIDFVPDLCEISHQHFFNEKRTDLYIVHWKIAHTVSRDFTHFLKNSSVKFISTYTGSSCSSTSIVKLCCCWSEDFWTCCTCEDDLHRLPACHTWKDLWVSCTSCFSLQFPFWKE
jgi:hypothetical protein